MKRLKKTRILRLRKDEEETVRQRPKH